jgi:diguanylate cyclase (GGDEF)-like protein
MGLRVSKERSSETALRAQVAELRQALEAERAARALAEQQRDQHDAELAALHQTALTLMDHHELGGLLRTIVFSAARLAGTEHGFLYLVNQAEHVLENTLGIGRHDEYVGYRLGSGQGLSGKVWATKQPMVVSDYATWPERMTNLREPYFHSIVAVPLLRRQEVVGVIGLSFDDPDFIPDERTINLISRFAQLAALALDNARLFSTIQRMAVSDPLTGLSNRRHFFAEAQRELERAQHFALPLAVIMLDVDDFKRVNDQHGHAIGDRVLQTIAQRCREVLRAEDLIGRYGGEEIVVLLPAVAHDDALLVAERLRTAVHAQHEVVMPISVSVGVAIYAPPAHLSLDMLVDRADQAQYHAKRSGKNRVLAWGAELEDR